MLNYNKVKKIKYLIIMILAIVIMPGYIKADDAKVVSSCIYENRDGAQIRMEITENITDNNFLGAKWKTYSYSGKLYDAQGQFIGNYFSAGSGLFSETKKLKKNCMVDPIFMYKIKDVSNSVRYFSTSSKTNLKDHLNEINYERLGDEKGYIYVGIDKGEELKTGHNNGNSGGNNNGGTTDGSNNGNSSGVNLDDLSCDVLFDNQTLELIETIFLYIKIGSVVAVTVLSILDYAKVVMAGDDDSRKKANKNLKVRIMVLVVLLVLPSVIEFILSNFSIPGLTNHNPFCR